ncbi:MAG: tRNA (adenosine(37)-N6)-threonylcarbamoyltransferase complex ATPase subunit type 1 TsaE [Proteobacteria bacterium]|jgi:tRNA threonylcarbamoyladenosine biosynthesis protein TsaE|nr:tRNA (adenosine(37)-N6)-threonylcarbamoyltransferase complex ATPase subunit type 1 TsaE [Pseudomonadota bacterium]
MTIQADFVADEAAMLEYGALLGKSLAPSELVFLVGELGMGKTTLARGILRGLGFTGHVKSPTYTLVEPYEFAETRVYHFDFYRIVDPEELQYIGLDDLLGEHAIKLVEWPERARGRLPLPDRIVRISRHGYGRAIEHEKANAAPLSR